VYWEIVLLFRIRKHRNFLMSNSPFLSMRKSWSVMWVPKCVTLYPKSHLSLCYVAESRAQSHYRQSLKGRHSPIPRRSVACSRGPLRALRKMILPDCHAIRLVIVYLTGGVWIIHWDRPILRIIWPAHVSRRNSACRPRKYTGFHVPFKLQKGCLAEYYNAVLYQLRVQVLVRSFL